MANIDKICVNCAKHFTFSTTEQNFYRQQGYVDPKRCVTCRRAYKRAISGGIPVKPEDCFECNPKMVRGVVTDAEHKCQSCGRLIEKSVLQYPVIRDGHAQS